MPIAPLFVDTFSDSQATHKMFSIPSTLFSVITVYPSVFPPLPLQQKTNKTEKPRIQRRCGRAATAGEQGTARLGADFALNSVGAQEEAFGVTRRKKLGRGTWRLPVLALFVFRRRSAYERLRRYAPHARCDGSCLCSKPGGVNLASLANRTTIPFYANDACLARGLSEFRRPKTRRDLFRAGI